MNKKQNLKMSPYEAVRKIQNAGLEVTGGLIVGNDGEKPEVFDNLYDFIQKSGIVLPMAGLLGVPPGTKLEKRLEEEGRLRNATDGSNTHGFNLDFEPKLAEGFSEEQLMEGYKGFLKDLFNPKNYYDRCRVLQKEIGKNHSGKIPISQGLPILGRFMKNQLTGGANLETAKYIAETLVKNPKQFPQAITHAVKYQHLKEITSESLDADSYPSRLEDMYHEFSEKAHNLSHKYKDNAKKASATVEKQAHKLVNKAEKLYHSIHPDFQQEHHSHSLENLKNKIQGKEYLNAIKVEA